MPPDWYLPYADTASGVPPMGTFGDGYRYHVTGLIHDVRGFPTERPDEIEPFLNRLFRKINQHFHDIQLVRRSRPWTPNCWWWPTVRWPGPPGGPWPRPGSGDSRRGCFNSSLCGPSPGGIEPLLRQSGPSWCRN